VPEIVSWAVDGLACLLLIAGGIAFAVGLKGVNCSDYNLAMAFNDMLNCGFYGKKDPNCAQYTCGPTCKPGEKNEGVIENYIKGRCRQATADEVFLFLAFVITAVALAFSFVMRGKGRSGYAV
jgi:Membrane-associating domain